MVNGRKQRGDGGKSEKRSQKLPTPTTPKERTSRVRLGCVGDTRRELSKVYREARAGQLDMAKACKLTYILVSIGKLIADETLEARITALERRKYEHD